MIALAAPPRYSSEVTGDADDLDDAAYRGLAGFRFHVRKFFAFSEQALAQAEITPLQYQALLAIRAHQGDKLISTRALADHLFAKLSSTVELVDRLAKSGLVERVRRPEDRRVAYVTLTTLGRQRLARLAELHLAQHRKQLPELLAVISQLE